LSDPPSATPPKDERRLLRIAFMVVAIFLPTLVTWVYFTLLASSPASFQKSAFSIGKSIQFSLPLIGLVLLGFWQVRFIGGASQIQWRTSVLLGLVSGLAIGLSIYCVNRFVLMPFGLMDGPTVEIDEKLNEFGLNSLSLFIFMGVGYATVHSLMEEYYWRWFVFGNLSNVLSIRNAVFISAIGFMLHHVLVLARYFGWGSPLTYLGSAGVAVGGVVWALIYHRTGTLLGCWISHAIVDAAIFIVGYELAFG
jgi:uncharacterized protein